MKRTYSTLELTFGAILLAFLAVPGSHAQCGGYPAPFATHTSRDTQPGQARLVRAAFVKGNEDDIDDVSIVGFWHVKFFSNGVSSGIPGGVPKGAEVDAGYSQWHADGTEIMNSGGRAPNTGDFCLGVWEKVGVREYKLNHFGAAWDPNKGTVGPAGPVGELIGPGHIQENVTMARDGKSFIGHFSINQYDEAGNVLVHLEGKITGTRITVNTPEASVF